MKRYLLASICISMSAFGMEPQEEKRRDSTEPIFMEYSDVYFGSDDDAFYMSRTNICESRYRFHFFDKKTTKEVYSAISKRLSRCIAHEDACAFHESKAYIPADYAGKIIVHDCKKREGTLLEFGKMALVTSMAITKAGLLYVFKQAYNPWYDEREKKHHYPETYHVIECFDTKSNKLLAEHFNMNNNSPGNPQVHFTHQCVVGEQTCFLDEHRNTLHFFDKNMVAQMLLRTAPWPINSLVKNVVKGNNLYYLDGEELKDKAPVDCPTRIARYNVITQIPEALVEFKENHAAHLAVNDEQSVLIYSTQLYSKEMPLGFLAAVNITTKETIWKKNIRDYDLYVGALDGLAHAKQRARLYVMERNKPHMLVTIDATTGEEITRKSFRKQDDWVLTHSYLYGLLNDIPVICKT